MKKRKAASPQKRVSKAFPLRGRWRTAPDEAVSRQVTVSRGAQPCAAADTRTAECRPYRRVLALLRPYRLLILASILLSAAAVGLTLYLPVLVGRAIDCIVGCDQVDFDGIGKLLLRIALFAALTALVQWLVSVINNRVSYQTVRDLRNRAFRHLQHLPLSWLDRRSVGSVVSQIITDVDQFADGLLLGFTQLFTGVITILGTLSFMLSIKPLIALIVIVLTPLSFLVAKFIASHTHSYFLEQSKTRGEQTAYVDELLGGQKVVKAFGREDRTVEDFDAINDRLERTSLKAVFFSSLTNPCTRFVNSVVYAAVVLTGALLCVSSAGTEAVFTVGSLSALLAYANQYTKPFNEISGVVTEFQNALACAGRIFELMDEPEEVDAVAGDQGTGFRVPGSEPVEADAHINPSAPERIKQNDSEGRVQMVQVSFSYSKDKPLIENLSFTAQPGQRIAIVGPTGCGKTTLINLLMRFYDVDGGAIRVDGTELREMTRASLRAKYGMVLQETWLRSGTIRENLTLGKPEATDAELEAACRAAHAHSFIRLLPQGYDTYITEDGGMLSQGQKQLLCIARIMLCLPPMLILDEATSSIDTRTELKIQSAFARMMRGRTSFIVAHRLSTIREADVILVMREGKVIEIGNHEELLKKGGFYADLYNSQFAD
ncbi:MAG: ABC transporter ATP-binding protein [Oscillospiraceae bacterium]|nr:ABC transporter ATP-binding protein [Oscillospiraceae bacterium]